MASIFTKIIEGEVSCHKIAENEDYFSFLDIRPMALGHTLVIPKLEVDKFFDLPAGVLQDMMPFAQSVANALEAVVSCERVGVVVAGLEVPHAHMHLIPINSMQDLSFDKPALNLTQEEMHVLAEKISSAWRSF